MPAQLRAAPLGESVLAGFSTRVGGESVAPFDSLNLSMDVGDDPVAVQANRAALVAAVGIATAPVWAEQVHGGDVAVVTANDAGRTVEGVDALVTAERGILVCIRVADCLPVLFADPLAGVIGAAHAGRRGLADGVLHNTVQAMENLGADVSRMEVHVGPGICGKCYEVPAELAAEFDVAVPGAISTTRSGTPSLDLPMAALGLLAQLGFRSVSVGVCTFEDPDRWYSYRRAAPTGRFVGFVTRP
ncbi:MAG: peptidoglycan editing factor PgeF [Mycobacteriales bacterium]